MIVREADPAMLGFGQVLYYAACLDCGWCGRPRSSARRAGDDDDNHLAAKLAAGDRREVPASLTPSEEPGSVATSFGVPGDPYGKGRPRAARRGRGVRVYTPQETLDAEERVRGAWRHAGAVELGDGPLALTVVAVHGRGPSYWLKNGDLSAYGRRMGAVPTLKPDLDNVVKLVADALNGAAYGDDSQIVHVVARRRWALPGEPPHVHVHLSQENA